MDEPFRYEIRVAEKLDERWAKWFGDMEILTSKGDSGTTFQGELIDQAALFGVLNHIHDLGLTLISVLRLQE